MIESLPSIPVTEHKLTEYIKTQKKLNTKRINNTIKNAHMDGTDNFQIKKYK